jgi:hypothetical protein
MGCCSSNVKEYSIYSEYETAVFWRGREVPGFGYIQYDLLTIYEEIFEEKNKLALQRRIVYLQWLKDNNNYHLFPKKDKFERFNLSEIIDFMFQYKVAYFFNTTLVYWIKIFEIFKADGVFVKIKATDRFFEVRDHRVIWPPGDTSVEIVFGIRREVNDCILSLGEYWKLSDPMLIIDNYTGKYLFDKVYKEITSRQLHEQFERQYRDLKLSLTDR